MNRPLLFVVIGGIVVIIATALNFILLREDVQSPPPEQQLATENQAAAKAAEQARLDAQKATEAARKAAEALKDAERAKAEAEAARQNLARAAADTATAARAESEATERDAAANAARERADKARGEAEETRLTAERTAKIAEAEAAAARQIARAAEAQRATSAEPPKPPAQSPAPTLPITPQTAAPPVVSPSFDVVRIERDGSAVIAGRAAPESEVVVRAGRDVIGRARSNGHGEWVLVPDRPLAPGNLELALTARKGEAEVASDSAVVVVVPERVQTAAASPAAPPPAPAAGTPRDALAVAVPKAGGGASRVLQGVPKVEDMRVAVDAVDYDDAGNLTISGYAPKGGRLNVYLDNRFVGQTQADDQSRWSLRPEGTVTPGLYTLRVDLVDPSGTVLARVAFPFSRAQPMPDLKPGDFVVVQPGNSLWRIARRTYGAGVEYHEIYTANRDQIQDPDLIYPGQIFALPKVN